MDDARDLPGGTGKPDSVDAFRESLLNERHLFTNRMLDAIQDNGTFAFQHVVKLR